MMNKFEIETKLRNDLIKRNTSTPVIETTILEKDFVYHSCLCPNCKTSLIKAKKQCYCDKCGQKLKW